jgi:hypothetical protein
MMIDGIWKHLLIFRNYGKTRRDNQVKRYCGDITFTKPRRAFGSKRRASTPAESKVIRFKNA